ncbi:MAG: hypothetical protein AAGE52_08000 [Myxococcota bacterium]
MLVIACERRELPAPPPPEEPAPQPPVTPDQVYRPIAQAPAPVEDDRRIVDAFLEDAEYQGAEPEDARRLVYRISLRVPRSLGVAPDELPKPSGELYVDLSRDRLRARFSGGGWPIDAGAEVRLRRDEPGVYVFDGDGGRPLGPGQLAQWFEGGRLRFEPGLRVRPPPSQEQSGPGNLMCRLIAEWTNSSPDELARRCGEGGSPPDFRIGVWRAERTADVAVQLPRSSLRADHVDPPPPIPRAESRAFLSPEVMSRISRSRGPVPQPAENAPGEGLVITNRGRSRMMVTVQGTPVGWLDRGVTAHFVGLRPGSYRVGAMRPFGLQSASGQPAVVPGRLALPRWVPRRDDDD